MNTAPSARTSPAAATTVAAMAAGRRRSPLALALGLGGLALLLALLGWPQEPRAGRWPGVTRPI